MAEPNKEKWMEFIKQEKKSKMTHTRNLIPEVNDYLRKSMITKGFFVHGYYPCRKCPIKTRCEFYKGECYHKTLPDGREIPIDYDCAIEKFIDEEYREKFRKDYGLDDKADEILLNTVMLSMIRIYRINRWLTANDSVYNKIFPTQYGDATSRELTPEEKILDNETKKLHKILNELAVSRKAREGTKVHVQKDVSIMLSNLSQQLDDEIDGHVEIKYTDENGNIKSKWVKKESVRA